MIKVYLDLETYRPNQSDAFINEKIIAIGTLMDFNGAYSASIDNEIKEYRFEDPIPSQGVWEYIETDEKVSEKGLISRFYELLEAIKKRKKIIMIIGYNILRFDIPLLIQRSHELKVKNIKEANAFFFNTFTIDYFQLCLPLNDMWFKGNTLRNCAEKLGEINQISPYLQEISSSDKIAKFYENKEYNKIIEHLRADLRLVRYIDLKFSKGLQSPCYSNPLS
jgi:DNA polymerase elongation subunit (family B)